MKLTTVMVIGLLGALLIVAGCGSKESAPAPPLAFPEPVAEAPAEEEVSSEGVTVEVSDEGFNPNTLTVSAGTMVTFTNTDANERQHWPASAVHPTHEVYPGSGINKCAAAKRGEVQIFDACEGLRRGDSFSFTFNEKGEWKYHDHLRPSSTGTIVVE